MPAEMSFLRTLSSRLKLRPLESCASTCHSRPSGSSSSFCSEHFPGLADILDCLAADQLWALLSMRVQLALSDQPHAQSAAVRFGGLGRRYVLVAFGDRPVGLLSHADGSGLFPEARPKLTALSWEEIRLALMLDIGSN